jgi:hypothetical protein
MTLKAEETIAKLHPNQGKKDLARY